MASLLSKFKFTVAERSAAPTANVDPVQRARQKLSAALDEQIAYVHSDISGEPITRTVKKYEGEGENRKAVEKDKRIRKWYWKQGDTYVTEIRYGTKTISFGKNNGIICGADLEDVISVYDQMKKVIAAGEIDPQLEQASKRVRADNDDASPDLPLASQPANPVPKRGRRAA